MSAPAVSALAAVYYCFGYADYLEIKDSLLSCAIQSPNLVNQAVNGNVLHFDASCLTTGSLPDQFPPELSISIFPNPTSEKIMVQPTERIEDGRIWLFDLSGKIIFSKPINSWDSYEIETINIQDSPPGIYFLNIQLSNYIWSYKIIKM